MIAITRHAAANLQAAAQVCKQLLLISMHTAVDAPPNNVKLLMGKQLRSSAHAYGAAQLCSSLWRCAELLMGMQLR